jgi:hypothetical protein
VSGRPHQPRPCSTFTYWKAKARRARLSSGRGRRADPLAGLRLEAGGANPKLDTLRLLARELGVSLDALAGLAGPAAAKKRGRGKGA